MKVEDLEFKIFENLETLKRYIKDNFDLEDEVVEIEHDQDFDSKIDDELGFCDGTYDYFVYYMKGASGRVIVVETSKQTY